MRTETAAPVVPSFCSAAVTMSSRHLHSMKSSVSQLVVSVSD